MQFEVGSFSAAFVFVGITVLAVAVICLVIWVAVLSNRQRKLTDWMMTISENSQDERPIDIRVVQPMMQPVVQSTAQAEAWMAAQTRQDADTGYDYEYESYEDAEDRFFDRYHDEEFTQQAATSFGRATPTIPFGEDKNDVAKRESYMEDAISSDFEPDSIDFSRVAGYKRRQ